MRWGTKARKRGCFTSPPKLTLPEVLLGTGREFEPLADDNDEEACSGQTVVVVGGRVSEG